jgi:magnesium-transporting ATPase (P-type)
MAETETKTDKENHERQLQIDLAKRQTDVQTHLAIAIALIAMAAAFMIALFQAPVLSRQFVILGTLVIVFGCFGIITFKWAFDIRDKMDELK